MVLGLPRDRRVATKSSWWSRSTSKLRTLPIAFFAGTLVLGGGALTFALTVSLGRVDSRTVAVAAAGVAGVVAAGRRDASVRIALVLIPIIAFVRRVTAGPGAYVANDPLVLVPVLLMVPVLWTLPRTRAGTPARVMTYLLALLLVSGALSAVSGAGATAVFGTTTTVLPLWVGIHVATGRFDGLSRFAVRMLPWVGLLTAVYGVVQWRAPASWDLAWLRTQHDALISVGEPVAGQFRIFATSESPGALALFLGLAIVALAADALTAGGVLRGRVALLGIVLPVMVFALALTAVRTALFALPIALLIVLAANRRVSRPVVGVAFAVLATAVLLIPTLLAKSQTGRSRYDLAQLGQDQSFQDRSQLLPKFLGALSGNPLGSGPGTSGLAARLDSSPASQNMDYVQNVDNGFLARLIETGVLGLALFFVVVVLCLRPAFRRLRGGQPRAGDAAWFAVAVFFLLSDLGGPSTSTGTGVFFWIALGALGASGHSARKTTHGPRHRREDQAGMIDTSVTRSGTSNPNDRPDRSTAAAAQVPSS